MRFARTVFVVAGIYGMAAIIPMYFMETRIGRELPPSITHPEFFYGFLGVTLAWQLLFLMLATDPPRYQAMMIPAIVEKVSYGGALAALMLEHRLPALVFTLGSVDWIFAILFIASYTRTKQMNASRPFSTNTSRRVLSNFGLGASSEVPAPLLEATPPRKVVLQKRTQLIDSGQAPYQFSQARDSSNSVQIAQRSYAANALENGRQRRSGILDKRLGGSPWLSGRRTGQDEENAEPG